MRCTRAAATAPQRCSMRKLLAHTSTAAAYSDCGAATYRCSCGRCGRGTILLWRGRHAAPTAAAAVSCAAIPAALSSSTAAATVSRGTVATPQTPPLAALALRADRSNGRLVGFFCRGAAASHERRALRRRCALFRSGRVQARRGSVAATAARRARQRHGAGARGHATRAAADADAAIPAPRHATVSHITTAQFLRNAAGQLQ